MRQHGLVTAVLAFLLPAVARSGPLVDGLDHMPVAVADLDLAAADFAKLGFVIKPGRAHDDGIRNRHVKFPNGGGIELITASAPADRLAREYSDWLRGGDGPAFWSLYSRDLVSLTALLAGLHLAPVDQGDLVTFSQAALPHRLFFADRLRSPTDGPVYWAHPNTAFKLAGVWLAGTDPDQRLFAVLGATRRAQDRCSPFEPHAAAFMVPGEGDMIMVAPSVKRSQDRSIIGATILVHSLAVARRVLAANRVAYVPPLACEPRSVWVPPAAAHNAWLEFQEPEGK